MQDVGEEVPAIRAVDFNLREVPAVSSGRF
jgi:hypothetical protein